MNKTVKTYKAVFDPKKTKGVFGISLVENPAMEGHFLALSEDEKEIRLAVANEEERILIGLVLEPNKPVYRNQGGEEFYVTFSEETVKELSYGFYKGGFHKNSSLEHSDKIEGVTFVESWLIEDSEKDKSAALGLSYPKGSWMATMKVDSDDVWESYVKTGKVKGFSVDALVSLEEVKLKSDIKMSDTKRIAEAIKDGFEAAIAFLKNEKPLKLGSVKTSNADVDIQFDGDTLQAGSRVWIMADDGATEVPLPVGEYELEDKSILVVSEEGKAGEIKPAPTEETTPPAPAPPAEMSKEESKGLSEMVKSILVKYQEETVNPLLAQLKEQKQEIDTLKSQVVELSAAPAAKPKTSAPEQKPLELKTAKQRIFNALQNS